ncbi:MAG: ribose-phosphate pyrophosphokinase [bacterium]
MAMHLKVISGNANRPLAEEISQHLCIELVNADITRFSDQEIFVQINENVRGSDVYVIQSISTPANENLMELLILIDALRRASARRITAVIPYYGYARQDRKVQPRVPITARLVANLITTSGANRVLTVDLHAGQIQGFFNIPVDNLFATPVLLNYLKQKEMTDIVVVSPDAGGVERARAYAKKLNASLAIIDKRREKANVSEVMNIIGDVKDKNVIMADDIVDTAGTLTQSVSALKEAGARKIVACCTHPVLSGPAIQRINESLLEELVVTNTIKTDEIKKKCQKVTVLSVANLLGEAIKRIYDDTSVSSLFT